MSLRTDTWLGAALLALISACSASGESGKNEQLAKDAGAGSGGNAAAGGSGSGAGPGGSAAAGRGGAGAGTGGNAAASGSGSGGTTSGAGGVAGSGGAPPGGRGSDVSFDGTTIRASIIARAVPPGGEEHVCVTVELPNPNAVWIDDIQATLAGGSHHLIVDRRAAGTELQTEPSVCFPTTGGEDTRLIIAQQTATRVALPAGVAFPMLARQPLFLQLHYFNSGAETRDITGTVALRLANTSNGTPIEAKSIFTGSTSISLPPHAPGSSQFWFPMQVSAGRRHVFALTSHTHKLGVRSTIERVPNGAPATTPIHESLDWSEPPLTQFSPPLVFDGGDGLRLICNYENTTDRTVGFGTGVDQEMCFMWIYYFDR